MRPVASITNVQARQLICVSTPRPQRSILTSYCRQATHPFRAKSAFRENIACRMMASQTPSKNVSQTQTKDNIGKATSMFARQTPLADPQTSFSGKTVLVTGANTGLGLEAAIKFAALGAERVILAVRDLSKGIRAKSTIEQRTGIGSDRIDVWKLDMADYRSIENFARRLEREVKRLDTAVLNAGVFMVNFEESQYGWEETMQINALSTALLGILLVPLLRRYGEKTGNLPVMEFVSSWNYAKVELKPEQRSGGMKVLETFNVAETYVSSKQYAASKLFVMCVMKTLALFSKSADGKPAVIINACCPGYCASELSRGHKGMLMDIMRWIANRLFLRTTEEGARALVSGVTVGEEVHGRFWRDDEIKQEAPNLDGAEGEALREEIWNEIVEALRKDIPTFDEAIAQLKHS